MNSVPEITVVIPTHGRPQLLARAIRSVLAQTISNFEIVVVIDGEDPRSEQAAARFGDDRIRLLTLKTQAGGGNARNAGVAAARGIWVAFLDDDDEFMPRKLRLQLAAAKRMDGQSSLLVSEALVRSKTGDVVWPERFPGEGESLCDYLFCRRNLRQGEAFLQTSTYFVLRSLAMRVPFRGELARHQDWDWLLRLEAEAGVRIVALREPLTIYSHGGNGPSVSRRRGWQESLQWAQQVVLPRSQRAYTFFMGTQCVTRLGTHECWSWKTLRQLGRECFVAGRPGVMSGFLFAIFWLRAMLQSSKQIGSYMSKPSWLPYFLTKKPGYNTR
jgi:hypothetical protein